VLGVVEEFSHELATVVRRFLRLKSWQDTDKIAMLAIGRAPFVRFYPLAPSSQCSFSLDLRNNPSHNQFY
jgi:hypothetical protein